MAMDFSENYTCRHGRETQSYHWNQKQITIHPMMLYYKQNGELQKDGYIAITDDLKHDARAVATFEKEAICHVRDRGVDIKKIHQWTDGCAAQYKGCNSFAEISQADSKHGCSVTRNYFETSHGKGPCDGLGGIVKRKVSNAIVQNNDLRINTAAELHKFCDSNLSTVGASSFNSRRSKFTASTRTFKLIDNIDRSEVTSAKTVPGSRKLHSVSSTGVNFQLKVRSLSCYCEGCRNNEQCTNNEYIEPWEVKVLKPMENETAVSAPENEEKAVNNEEEAYDTEEVASDRMEPLAVNDFVAVKFETKKSRLCYFAKVTNIEADDVFVEYLEKSEAGYQYSANSKVYLITGTDVVCKLPVPEIVVSGTRVKSIFKLDETQKKILEGYKLQ